MTSPRQNSAKILNTPGYNFIVAMVTDLWGQFNFVVEEEQGIQCMSRFSRIISEVLPRIHTIVYCKHYTFYAECVVP